jgi:cytidylate kinase
MVPAADAVLLDSTHLTHEQVVERMEQEVRRRADTAQLRS